MPTSIADSILKGANLLRGAGVPYPRREAGSLMAYTLGRDRTYILCHADDFITGDDESRFGDFLEARMTGRPLQYITGHQEFFGLDFEVTPDVLIPRPETELLVETALKLMVGLKTAPFVCDVGTGSGCIPVALLHELRTFPATRAVAIDVSEAALSVAKRNATRHSVVDRIEFIVSDCFAKLDPARFQFDLIVSNPPYVAARAIAGLQREVRDFEPRLALEAGIDGLDIVRRLLAEAGSFLKPQRHLLIEIGFDQREAVEKLVDRDTWELIDIHKDLQGIPRTVALEKRG
ncbi:MAG TPA: peptide chain release factor N(5)-glutamine methyltransferase [Pyrinomonadaceae bacterium]|nr:peptide chain release factor N(5)-glutamine methyltransferase [Pyrinomonadaceae bacterium]